MTDHMIKQHPPLWPDALLAASGIAIAPLVALGFGRFAYGLVLPEMRADLGWSYATAGFATTVNGVGYLLGALAAAQVTARFGVKRTMFMAWAVIAVAMGATGFTRITGAVIAARGVVGLASGLAYVAGASLAAHLASQMRIRPGLSLGLLQAGVGAGIALSGILVFASLSSQHVGWQPMWIVLGVSSIAALVCAMWMLRAVREARRPGPGRTAPAIASLGAIIPALIGYFLFGLGYIAYMTFIVALLRLARADNTTVTVFWVVLGLSAFAGSIAWGLVLDRFRGGRGPAAVLGATFVGAALPVLSSSTVVAMISGVIFGSSFLATASAVMVVARRILPSHTWTLAIGVLTVAFGIGQSIGPSLAGIMSDGPGGIRSGLALSSAFLLAGTIVLALQRERAAVEPDMARLQ